MWLLVIFVKLTECFAQFCNSFNIMVALRDELGSFAPNRVFAVLHSGRVLVKKRDDDIRQRSVVIDDKVRSGSAGFGHNVANVQVATVKVFLHLFQYPTSICTLKELITRAVVVTVPLMVVLDQAKRSLAVSKSDEPVSPVIVNVEIHFKTRRIAPGNETLNLVNVDKPVATRRLRRSNFSPRHKCIQMGSGNPHLASSFSGAKEWTIWQMKPATIMQMTVISQVCRNCRDVTARKLQAFRNFVNCRWALKFLCECADCIKYAHLIRTQFAHSCLLSVVNIIPQHAAKENTLCIY